jgi:hypothetical protein
MKPRHEKVMADGFALNKNHTYQYIHSYNGEGIHQTVEEKGNFTVQKNELIIFYPDSIKEENYLPWKTVNKLKYYLDTLYIFNHDQEILLYAKWNCYLKLTKDKPLDIDKYNKYCNHVKQLK